MHQAIIFPLFSALLFFSTFGALASVPPDYREPTIAQMINLGFKFRIRRDAEDTSFELHFPKILRTDRFTLVPQMTDVIVKSIAGEAIAKTTNWVAQNKFMLVDMSYRQKESDLSVSVTYTCPANGYKGCYGATILSIPSVSEFINKNPDLVNVRPKCRKVSNSIIDCTKYGRPEYP